LDALPGAGPEVQGTNISADHFYHNWVDRYNTLGLGKNVPIVNGTGADSLIAFLPETKKFVTMRVPYPLDFYTRNMEGRIDDPNAGWKGRGLWTGNEEKVIWHLEGGRAIRPPSRTFRSGPTRLPSLRGAEHFRRAPSITGNANDAGVGLSARSSGRKIHADVERYSGGSARTRGKRRHSDPLARG
jgi:hypothetical protein